MSDTHKDGRLIKTNKMSLYEFLCLNPVFFRSKFELSEESKLHFNKCTGVTNNGRIISISAQPSLKMTKNKFKKVTLRGIIPSLLLTSPLQPSTLLSKLTSLY